MGGNGTEVALGDYGDYQDKSTAVDLPFPFQFYGETFTSATICSNGWIAMGDTYLTDYRNWTSRAPAARNNLIAAFWDDLYEVNSPAGHVYQKYDAANHRWIVEWSRMHNVTGGDGDLPGDPLRSGLPPDRHGRRDHHLPVQHGREHRRHRRLRHGRDPEPRPHRRPPLHLLQRLPGGRRHPRRRAGHQVPARPRAQPSGDIQGTVRNASHNLDPLPGAVVSLLGTTRTYASGPDGAYGGTAPQGTYTAVCSRAGFAPDTVSRRHHHGRRRPRRWTSSLDDIAGPAITGVTQLLSTTDTAGPYAVDATVDDPSGVGAVTALLPGRGRRLDRAADDARTPASGSAAIPGLPAGSQVDYYVRAQDSLGHAVHRPGRRAGRLLHLPDHRVFYATDCEDPAIRPGSSAWPATTPPPASGSATTRSGPATTASTIQPEDDHTPDPGVKCFVTGNGAVGGAPGDADVDGGCTTLQSPVFDLSDAPWALVRYWRWWGEGGNSIDDEFVVDVSRTAGSTWVPLERVPDAMTAWGLAAVDLTTMITLTDQVVFRFLACDLNTAGLVEAAVDDFSLEVFSPDSTDVPAAPAGPAVFAPGARPPEPVLRQHHPRLLAGAGRPGAAGGLRRRGPDGAPAGERAGRGRVRTPWSGTGGTTTGPVVPSGIYFYRLDAGGHHRMEKLLRLR